MRVHLLSRGLERDGTASLARKTRTTSKYGRAEAASRGGLPVPGIPSSAPASLRPSRGAHESAGRAAAGPAGVRVCRQGPISCFEPTRAIFGRGDDARSAMCAIDEQNWGFEGSRPDTVQARGCRPSSHAEKKHVRLGECPMSRLWASASIVGWHRLFVLRDSVRPEGTVRGNRGVLPRGTDAATAGTR